MITITMEASERKDGKIRSSAVGCGKLGSSWTWDFCSCQNAKMQPKVTVLSENTKLFCLLLHYVMTILGFSALSGTWSLPN